MSKQKEYRVIFFYDNKHNMERYTIVEGTWQDATAVMSKLRADSDMSNVSQYFPVENFYVGERTNTNFPIRFTPSRSKELSQRIFWEGKK